MTQLRIIFLGTGGSWPTLHRNTTAIAVKRGSDIILFDCGEGTQRQFQRSNLSYMQVIKIFISHFHGDHFLGIPGLLQTMQLNDRNEPLHIYGPQGMNQLLKQLVSLGYFRPVYEIISHEVKHGDIVKCDGYKIHVFSVSHNVPSLGFSLEEDIRPGRFNKQRALELGVPEGPMFSRLQHGQIVVLARNRKITPSMVLGPERLGRKIVYSGDTTPCDTVASHAADADVLIHEATFDSSLENLAAEYGHSTALQAATIAKNAHVERLFLTHISPRYIDIKGLETEAQNVFKKSFVPRDLQEFEIKLKK